MKRSIKLFILSALIGFTNLVFYTNCSPGFTYHRVAPGSIDGASILGSTFCDEQLKSSFSRVFYPFLTSNCTGCHIAGGDAGGKAFASADLNVAFDGFKRVGLPTTAFPVRVSSGHGGAVTDGRYAAEMNTIISTWGPVQDKYVDCLSFSDGTFIVKGESLKTESKMGPSDLFPTESPAVGTQAAWKQVTWDLETEVPEQSKNKYKATATLDVRPYYYNGSMTGFQFRNPRFKLKPDATGVTYEAYGLSLELNESSLDITTWMLSNAVINSTTDSPMLDPGGGVTASNPIFVGSVDNTNKFALILTHFGDPLPKPPPPPPPNPVGVNIELTVPDVVSYNDLVGTNNMVNMFAAHCVTCHNNTTASGSLNLQDYTDASATSATIAARIEDPMKPMPPSGLLPQVRIDIIKKWISLGTPQQ